MEQLLQWNPNDNQGVRLIIGSEYLRARRSARHVAIAPVTM